MIVGHEIAHLKLGHLNFSQHFVMLSMFIPFLYQAYSRAREANCDALGLYACNDLKNAQHALLLLSCGKKMHKEVNLAAYHKHGADLESQGWMQFARLLSFYPYLYERVERLEGLSTKISQVV